MSTFKSAIDKSFKKWFLNSEGELSWTKLGLNIGGIGAAVLVVPTLGLGIAIPAGVIAGAKLTCVLGGVMAGTGAKDTVDKNADKVVESNK